MRHCSAKDNNNIYIIHSPPNFFFPVTSQMLFYGIIFKIKWAIRLSRLTHKHDFCVLVMVNIKADKYSFFISGHQITLSKEPRKG